MFGCLHEERSLCASRRRTFRFARRNHPLRDRAHAVLGCWKSHPVRKMRYVGERQLLVWRSTMAGRSIQGGRAPQFRGRAGAAWRISRSRGISSSSPISRGLNWARLPGTSSRISSEAAAAFHGGAGAVERAYSAERIRCYEDRIPDRWNRISRKSLHPKLSLNPGVRRSKLCSRR